MSEGADEQGRTNGEKSRRVAARLVWPLYGLMTCLVIATSAVGLLSQGSNNVLRLAGDTLVEVATPVVFAVVGALIVSRQPRNTIGWLLTVVVGAFLVGEPLENYVDQLASSSPEPTLPLLVAVWFSDWGWLLFIFPLLLILLLFPTGRPPTPRWRWVGVAAIGWGTLFVLMTTLSRRLTTPDLAFDNPIGVLGEGTVELLAGLWIVGLLMLLVACALALFIRYRRASDTEREQIKWLLYACAVFVVIYVGGTIGGVAGTNSVGGDAWGIFFGLSLLMLPAAIGIAVLRYRLYDIDVVINRTLVYIPLTTALIALYFGGIVLLQRLFLTLTGGQSTLAIVASTLLIAALFNPLRRRIQWFIDRRFYRRKYDAAKILEGFSTKLRDQTDLEVLNDNLVGVVKETMQPAHVSVWLRPETRSEGEKA